MDINDMIRELPPTQVGYTSTKFNMDEEEYTEYYSEEIAENYNLKMVGSTIAHGLFEKEGLSVKILINKNMQTQHDNEVSVLEYANELECEYVLKMYYNDSSKIITEKVRVLTEEEFENTYCEEIDQIVLELQELGIYAKDVDNAYQWGLTEDGRLVLIDLDNCSIDNDDYVI